MIQKNQKIPSALPSSTPKSKRGGSRAGAGRKPIEGTPFTDFIIIRVTPDQKSIFLQKGGSRWVRSLITQARVDMLEAPAKQTDISKKNLGT